MKLENTMRIPVGVPQAWQALLDIERIAPCVPGATLVARDGDRYEGRVKVKLGPIALTYNGSVAFVSLDETDRVVVMEAAGREIRGGGTAKATITCRLSGRSGATDVHVETDLAISGKPAQFGRGALNDVATTMLDQFAANLAAELAPAPAAPVTAATAGAPAAAGAVPAAAVEAESAADVPAGAAVRPATSAQPIDVLRAVGPARAAVPAGAALLGMVLAGLVVRIVRGRRRG